MGAIAKIFNLNDPGWGRGGAGQQGDGQQGGQNSGQSDGQNNNGTQEPPRRPRPYPGNGAGNRHGNRHNGPELEDVWRDFNNRLNSLFGGGKRGGNGRGHNGQNNGNGSGNQAPSVKGPRILAIGALVLVLFWLGSSFMVVQEGQVAVVTRFGKYTKTLPPGLQWRLPYPVESHQTVNISQLRTFEVGYRGTARNKVLPESLMLTTDENIVDVQFVVQYRLNSEGAPNYLFKTVQPDESVRQAVETSMREIVGQQPMDSVLYSGRTEIALRVQQLAQEILDRYQTGIQVSTVAIQNVQPPEQVQAAFDDAVKAGQDRERLINEGNAYASRVLPEAQGQVVRMLQEAEGYRAQVVGDAQGDTARFLSVESEYVKAPGVERMYLSTMQSILQRSGKVILDAADGNNMLYLPLDKLGAGGRSSLQPGGGGAAAGNAGGGAGSVANTPERAAGAAAAQMNAQRTATQNRAAQNRAANSPASVVVRSPNPYGGSVPGNDLLNPYSSR